MSQHPFACHLSLLSRHLLAAPCVLLIGLLVGCKPADERVLTTTSTDPNSCLDRACPGEEWPKHDHLNESLMKVNGQWYVGPKVYLGGTGNNHAEFAWWEHKPIPGGAPRPPALQAEEAAGKGYDYSVQIFFRSRQAVGPVPTGFDPVKQAEVEGRVLSKTTLRKGLERWLVRDPIYPNPVPWYVATDLQMPNGKPAVLFCGDSKRSELPRCTTGYFWQTDIAVDMRFAARHAEDWPEIYQEAIRVLQLLRKV